jgi:hypothetical protein
MSIKLATFHPLIGVMFCLQFDIKVGHRHNKDEDYGVTRGIDFKRVRNVINFDFPETPEAYVHRVGRFDYITFHFFMYERVVCMSV